MDDIKYVANWDQLDSLAQAMRIFSEDIQTWRVVRFGAICTT